MRSRIFRIGLRKVRTTFRPIGTSDYGDDSAAKPTPAPDRPWPVPSGVKPKLPESPSGRLLRLKSSRIQNALRAGRTFALHVLIDAFIALCFFGRAPRV